MLAVATLAVALSAYALNFMMRRFAEFSLVHDAQMAGSSTRAAEVFRSYFADRKDEFRRRAEAIIADPPARMADLAAYEGLLRAQLLVGTEVVYTWEAPAETLGRSRKIVIDHGGDVSVGAAPAPLADARFVVELPC